MCLFVNFTRLHANIVCISMCFPLPLKSPTDSELWNVGLECNINAVSHKTVISSQMWKCCFSAQEKNGLAGDSPIVREILLFFFFLESWPHGILYHTLRQSPTTELLNPALGLQVCWSVSSEWPRACGVSVLSACSAGLGCIILL